MPVLKGILKIAGIVSAYAIFLSAPCWGATGELSFTDCIFAEIFHKLSVTESVTSLRQELKRVVPDTEAARFIEWLSDHYNQNGQTKVSVRDLPPSPNEEFVTETAYLPVMKGVRGLGKNRSNVFSGVIRIRKYQIVEKGTPVLQVMDETGSRVAADFSKLAEGGKNTIFAKLELKVGHPETGADGIFQDALGIVDKPGVVLAEKDIALLFKDRATYEANRPRVERWGKRLRLIRGDGKKVVVNDPTELVTMLDRIGLLHEEAGPDANLNPVSTVHYKRVARKVDLKSKDGRSYSAQVTVDDQIVFTDLITQERVGYKPGERVVELKIPAEFANQTPDQLVETGHVELADLVRTYLAMTLAPGTQAMQGKRSRGMGLLQEENPPMLPLDP